MRPSTHGVLDLGRVAAKISHVLARGHIVIYTCLIAPAPVNSTSYIAHSRSTRH